MLAEELQKPIIKKFEKRKVHSPFINNIWVGDLGDMLLICKLNRGFNFLLILLTFYNKYAWVFPLKDRKGITIPYAFENFLHFQNHWIIDSC